MKRTRVLFSSKRRAASGTWVVVAVLLLGIGLALVALKFRQQIPGPENPATLPSSKPAQASAESRR